MEYLHDEQLMIALTGKQRQMRLVPVKALDQPDTEWIKVADTKGCIVFATGVMRRNAAQATATGAAMGAGAYCLCVAVKRQVSAASPYPCSLYNRTGITVVLSRTSLRASPPHCFHNLA